MLKSFSNICTIADVRDAKSLSRVLESDDIIINLAAEYHDDVNVQGARNVCAVQENMESLKFYMKSIIILKIKHMIIKTTI